jgi:hypothetical protein
MSQLLSIIIILFCGAIVAVLGIIGVLWFIEALEIRDPWEND